LVAKWERKRACRWCHKRILDGTGYRDELDILPTWMRREWCMPMSLLKPSSAVFTACLRSVCRLIFTLATTLPDTTKCSEEMFKTLYFHIPHLHTATGTFTTHSMPDKLQDHSHNDFLNTSFVNDVRSMRSSSCCHQTAGYPRLQLKIPILSIMTLAHDVNRGL
jgi:hypothetical protein